MSFGSRLGGFGANVSTISNTSTLGNTTTATGSLQDLQNDIVVPNIGDDSVSDIAFSPQAEFMAISNWDKKIEFMKLQIMVQLKVEHYMNMKDLYYQQDLQQMVLK